MSSTGQAAAKPSLSGVRIKARKGAAKAQAKHEPAVFRDQLYKHLEVVPPEDFDAVTNKLIQAGSTLEYQKYADAFFEILLAGGLLQPGGATFIEDGAPPAPFSILKAKEPVEIDDMKKYADVFHKVIRRYKYMQKPLEEVSLPGLIQCAHRWPEAQREKFSVMLGLLLSQGLASASAVQVLSKDHLVKDGFSLQIISSVFKAFLKDQGIDQLSSCLKKGGIKDIMEFFPVNRRTLPNLEAFFKEKGLPVVAEWYNKKRLSAMKEIIVAGLKEAVEHEESEENMIAFIKERQEEQPIPEGDLVACVWTGLMATVDWGARPDQLESLVIKEVTKFAPILEAFCNGPKTEVQLINTVQVFCYEESRIMKTFLQIIKILYNKDCISDQAIMYWHSKGSKSQGRQHFIKATEPLINFLKAQEDESEEE